MLKISLHFYSELKNHHIVKCHGVVLDRNHENLYLIMELLNIDLVQWLRARNTDNIFSVLMPDVSIFLVILSIKCIYLKIYFKVSNPI